MPSKARVTATRQTQSGPPSGPQPRGSDFPLAAIKLKRVVDEIIAKLQRDLPLQCLQPVVLKFDDVSALDVDQMVVMAQVGLEPGKAGLEIVLLHKIQLIEKAERPIDRRNGNGRVDGAGPGINRVDRRMIGGFRQDLKNDPTLLGHLQ